jgi:hypothetical protein
LIGWYTFSYQDNNGTGRIQRIGNDEAVVTTRQQILLEIETARMRHAWAKAEVKRGEPSVALVKYLQESGQELRTLQSLVASNKAAKR